MATAESHPSSDVLKNRSLGLGFVARVPVTVLMLIGAILMWMAQPPLGWWWMGWVAAVPWFWLGDASQYQGEGRFSRRQGWMVYFISSLYWLLTFWGIALANPLLIPCWIVLGFYLGLYGWLFVVLCRHATRRDGRMRLPLWIAGPLLWVGLEWIRGYAVTGLNSTMLGHTQADVATVIQVADIGGSYAVSLVVAMVNAAIASMIRQRLGFLFLSQNGEGLAEEGAAEEAGVSVGILHHHVTAITVAFVVLLSTLSYGRFRMMERSDLPQPGVPLDIALIQRYEPIDFQLTSERVSEIHQSYLRGSMEASQAWSEQHDRLPDLIVWPEAVCNPGVPWMDLEPGATVPPRWTDEGFDQRRFEEQVLYVRSVFQTMMNEMQAKILDQSIPIAEKDVAAPQLMVGTHVIRFAEKEQTHSGLVHVVNGGQVAEYYGKTHLVMFGEYVPLITDVPFLDVIVPDGLRLKPGPGIRPMKVSKPGKEWVIQPNICVETAIERVTVNQTRTLIDQGSPPDVIVNITNDAWFQGTSMLAHHRRCSQMVAASTHRPLVMASNAGPTVHISSAGQLVKSLPYDEHGHLFVQPFQDGRDGLYLWWGDGPAAVLGLLVGVTLVSCLVSGKRRRAREN